MDDCIWMSGHCRCRRGDAKSIKALIIDSGALGHFLDWVVLEDNSVTEMRDDRE